MIKLSLGHFEKLQEASPSISVTRRERESSTARGDLRCTIDELQGRLGSAHEVLTRTREPISGERVVDVGSGGGIDLLVAAGFTDFEITWKAVVFDGAPQASSASKFGTVGINFRANKLRG